MAEPDVVQRLIEEVADALAEATGKRPSVAEVAAGFLAIANENIYISKLGKFKIFFPLLFLKIY